MQSSPAALLSRITMEAHLPHPKVSLVVSDRPGFIRIKVESKAIARAEYAETPEGDSSEYYMESRRKEKEDVTYHYIPIPEIHAMLAGKSPSSRDSSAAPTSCCSARNESGLLHSVGPITVNVQHANPELLERIVSGRS